MPSWSNIFTNKQFLFSLMGLGGPEEDHQLHHCCWTGRVSEREEERFSLILWTFICLKIPLLINALNQIFNFFYTVPFLYNFKRWLQAPLSLNINKILKLIKHHTNQVIFMPIQWIVSSFIQRYKINASSQRFMEGKTQVYRKTRWICDTIYYKTFELQLLTLSHL